VRDAVVASAAGVASSGGYATWCFSHARVSNMTGELVRMDVIASDYV
jgi:hypothetical protein